jgi:two-component system, sensor histidine kinase RegB
MAPNHGIDAAWLVRLRWLLYLGLGGLVGWMQWGMGMHLPLGVLAALLAVGAVSNLVLWGWLAGGREARPALFFGVMLADTALLTALLAITGGPFNPFTALYLVHVVLATLVLPRALAWVQFVASFLAFASLFWIQGRALPAGLSLPTHQELMRLHLAGMLVAFAVSAGVVVYFMDRVLSALKSRDAELQTARAAMHRSEKLAALTTLAAGAAHELATPLGTIAVAAKELERALAASEAGAPFRDDAVLIRAEVQRCRKILEGMSAVSGELKGEAPSAFTVESWVREARDGVVGGERVDVEAGGAAQLSVAGPRGALGQALRNLLQNALEASDGRVRLTARAEAGRVTLEVQNGGPGIAPEVLARIGEPFFTTKPPGRGMGLGVFLTRSVAEHLGGGLSLESAPGEGARARLWVPERREGAR